MMSRKKYSSPKLIVMTRFNEENVLAMCKAGAGATETSTFFGCGNHKSYLNCVQCSDYSTS
ncbi:hypothetical protein [Methanocella sp. MCL-LM]|uniref:hypothetical protein n=1 Tax=Methanocella sp. MCL-LM TaxID=3412035 RepID=UPI003C77E87F